MKRWLAVLVVLIGACAGWAEDAQWRPDGKNVLVVYAADDADADKDGSPDSRQVAEYYAARRHVPQENLLGLTIGRAEKTGPWEYKLFYDLCLKPVYEKLHSKAADGKAFADHICYIVLCPGIPLELNTHHVAPTSRPSRDPSWWFAKTARRTPESFLISLDANYRIGCDAATGSPGLTGGGPLGASDEELKLPFYETYAGPGKGTHFRQLRHDNSAEYNFYLVTRLGLDVQTARDMIDGAVYAERFLRLPPASEAASFRPAIWLDQKKDFAEDHVAAMAHCVAMVQGSPGSMFALHKGLQAGWPTVIDNQLEEIGKVFDGSQHKPTVTARIASEGVDAEGVTLTPPSAGDSPGVLYFPKSCTVSAYATPAAPAATQPSAILKGQPKGSALVIGMDVERNRLLLDNVKGFAVGDTVAYVWPGQFPTEECFLFYGFYGLDEYEDVFKFPPGAMGIHVDSACMTWARNAMHRGIGATYGVIAEPLSAGIPYGDQVLSALSQGYDWAEANYAALKLAQRWVGVVFGDPLYAPFRSLQVVDKTHPTLGPVKLTASDDGIIVTAALAGQSEDELAEVALFRLEYGPTTAYGQSVDFYDWPDPEKSKADGRRFGYSRFFQATLKELGKGEPVHFRLTARDPFGHETRTDDAMFVP